MISPAWRCATSIAHFHAYSGPAAAMHYGDAGSFDYDAGPSLVAWFRQESQLHGRPRDFAWQAASERSIAATLRFQRSRMCRSLVESSRLSSALSLKIHARRCRLRFFAPCVLPAQSPPPAPSKAFSGVAL